MIASINSESTQYGTCTNGDDIVPGAVSTLQIPEQIHDDPEEGHYRVVQAVCVEDQEVFEARVIAQDNSPELGNHSSRMRYCIAIAVLSLLAMVTTLSVVLTKESEVIDTNEDMDETIIPLEKKAEKLRTIIAPLNADDVFNKNSPEYSSDRNNALDWLVRDRWLSSDTFDEWKIRQRYIVALFYFSTGGLGWKDQLTFLSNRNECDWSVVKTQEAVLENNFSIRGIICNKEGKIESIKMVLNNLSGTIPPELSRFSESIMELNIGGGTLLGTIPSFFEEFKILEIFGVNDHCLSGSIPDLSHLPYIQTITLENNAQLSGSLNGFCNGTEYKNSLINIVKSTCGKDKSSLVECDCCTCCNEDDFTYCDQKFLAFEKQCLS